MTTPGQITIAGKVISGLKLTIQGVTLDTVPEGLTWEELGELDYLTRIHIEADCIMDETPGAKGKIDGELGDETSAAKGQLNFKMIRAGLKVTGYQKLEDRNEAWRHDHGEPQTA